MLFEKFYRGAKEGAQSGVGLGLTICRAIVEAHGGTIRAENRAGRRCAFSGLRFPLPENRPQIVSEEEQLANVQ